MDSFQTPTLRSRTSRGAYLHGWQFPHRERRFLDGANWNAHLTFDDCDDRLQLLNVLHGKRPPNIGGRPRI